MLSKEGFSLILTGYFMTVFCLLIAVYPPLTLSTYAFTIFTLLYIILASNQLNKLRPSMFYLTRKIDVDRPLEGEVIKISIYLVNRSGERRNITVSDFIGEFQLVEGSPQLEKTLNDGEQVEFSYKVKAPKRGVYILGPLTMKIYDDYRLCFRQFVMEKEVKVFIRPFSAEKASLAESVKKVRALAFSGSGGSTKYGVEDLFRELIKYEEGYPLKHVDWRRTAREEDDIYVRKFDRLNRLKVLFMFECTISNDVGKPSLLDSVISSIATASLSFLEKGDTVAVKPLGTSPSTTFTAKNTGHYPSLLNFLTGLTPGISFDLDKESEEAVGYDVVYLIGRLASIDVKQMIKLRDSLRRKGVALFILIPIPYGGDVFSESLEKLERLRFEEIRGKAGFVTAVRQDQITYNIARLHRWVKALP